MASGYLLCVRLDLAAFTSRDHFVDGRPVAPSMLDDAFFELFAFERGPFSGGEDGADVVHGALSKNAGCGSRARNYSTTENNYC